MKINEKIYVGQNEIHPNEDSVNGAFVDIAGEAYYRIENYDRMRPFFMSIVSNSDHWMFISSLGGLTAGRKNPDHALFPYYTDDKIHDAQDLTGSKTLLLVRLREKTYLWEPFSDRYRGVYRIQRNLYKNLFGNKIQFEEINHDLGLVYSYTWCNSDRYGFVKHASLRNEGVDSVSVSLLDGFQNLLPYGVERAMQSERSTLLDAYKKNELITETGLGIFSLSSQLVDKPEPSEALKATTVWSCGLRPSHYLLTSLQLDRFRRGEALETEVDIRAERGAYFVQATLQLTPAQSREWRFVAEVDQGPEDIANLVEMLRNKEQLAAKLAGDVVDGTEQLKRIVASADGLQCTADRMTTARHFANVLFNVMRGGIFDDNYVVTRSDFVSFIQHFNEPAADAHQAFFAALPEKMPVRDLIDAAVEWGDRQLERLCYEYLPLTFSRRHGDPSRPWNTFSIDTRNEDGSKKLSYEGNWRDIFQNWESLSLSFPEFVESMICKFANASTIDGYNPYRITREGIDWEVLDPADPWSYIGYWGDHQIVYLLKLLEISHNHHPDRLAALLTQEIFAYSNVPYRIKPYRDLLQDPHNTILYDEALEDRIAGREQSVGADGKLVWDADDNVYLVNFTEKILVAVLAKMANFIPEGGIWMNTQRPEWNDANNALVGYGISMVTLCYLHRFLRFCVERLEALNEQQASISEEVADCLYASTEALKKNVPSLEGQMTGEERKAILDALGKTGGAYRARVYEHGFSGTKQQVDVSAIVSFFETAIAFAEHTIKANQRDDGLFHAYNLLSVDSDEVDVHPLYAMLEGQVAVLSTEILSGTETLDVLTAMKNSDLYRQDQNSYLLYPERELPRFVQKNNIPAEEVEKAPLLKRLAAAGDQRLVVQDARGEFHFNGAFRNAQSVEAALNSIAENGYEEEVEKNRRLVLDLFESVFDHHAFTGRSGTFFGYEGLGCIYWHMVSKHVLAIQESYLRAEKREESQEVLDRLIDFYYDAKAGIGLTKSPDVYGAFPFDPYSHTPGNAGAQQPGMTGQVKEDVLSRWGELGVFVEEGKLRFDPKMLKKSEFLTEPTVFEFYDIDGRLQQLDLDERMLAFTYCQVPVTYRLSDKAAITIADRQGNESRVEGVTLDADASFDVFARTGEIARIDVECFLE